MVEVGSEFCGNLPGPQVHVYVREMCEVYMG
jgi:hypothetical protein